MAGSIVTRVRQSGRPRGILRVDLNLAVTSSTTIARRLIGEFHGRLVAVLFDPAAGSGTTIPTTADFTLTDEAGAVIVSTTDFGPARYVYPTQVVTSNVGVAVTAATTAPDVNRDIFLAGKVYAQLAAAVNGDTGRVSLVIVNA